MDDIQSSSSNLGVIAHGSVVLHIIFVQIIVIKTIILGLDKQNNRNTDTLRKTLMYIWTHV